MDPHRKDGSIRSSRGVTSRLKRSIQYGDPVDPPVPPRKLQEIVDEVPIAPVYFPILEGLITNRKQVDSASGETLTNIIAAPSSMEQLILGGLLNDYAAGLTPPEPVTRRLTVDEFPHALLQMTFSNNDYYWGDEYAVTLPPVPSHAGDYTGTAPPPNTFACISRVDYLAAGFTDGYFAHTGHPGTMGQMFVVNDSNTRYLLPTIMAFDEVTGFDYPLEYGGLPFVLAVPRISGGDPDGTTTRFYYMSYGSPSIVTKNIDNLPSLPPVYRKLNTYISSFPDEFTLVTDRTFFVADSTDLIPAFYPDIGIAELSGWVQGKIAGNPQYLSLLGGLSDYLTTNSQI